MPPAHPDAGGEESVPSRPRSRRTKLLAITVPAALVLVLAGGWVAASTFESPAQREAAATAPTPSAITAIVEKGDLARTITSSVDLAPERQTSLELTGRESQVVTRTPTAPGTTLAAGGIALETNGRPVIALTGRFPFYRDLRNGDSGPDVRQLQEGLIDLGITVEPDGVFGKNTERAISTLYAKISYPAKEEPREEKAAESGPTDAGTPSAPEATAGPSGTPAAGPHTGSPEPRPAAPAHAAQIVVPCAELLVVPALPAVVVSTPAVGERLDAESRIALEAGTLRASTAIAPNIAAMIRPGTTVELAGPDGKPLQTTVHEVKAGAKPEDESTIVLDSPGIPDDWRGRRATATITISKAARDSLIVPSTAIVADGASRQYVLRRGQAGGYERVPVRETAALDGRSAVTVLAGGELSAGDRVRVK